MYGPGTGISVIAFPTGIAPLVVGNGGTDTGGSVTGGVLARGRDDPGWPVVGAGVSETAESPEMSKGTWRAHPANAAPVTMLAVARKNTRLSICLDLLAPTSRIVRVGGGCEHSREDCCESHDLLSQE
jgi:hypothetical protein